MYETHPSTYMSAADPDVFGNQEIVVQTRSPRRNYTPEDNLRLFFDADLAIAQEVAPFYVGFVEFVDPAHFPNVDVYAEKGSNIPTVAGVKIRNLRIGQVFDASDPENLFLRNGDLNQEDITNDAIAVWENMPATASS